ncbi:sigma factor-like helix-turn-helix DNA-binding protein [Streptomyces sp. ADI93-02]|uniref:sigma factor-like helix-turn-helix DNA-binding protein n=1 Tax=Streptomyces sp. ADI93-02 TaxID=1522757 RepID=UPI001F149DF4|nr:sigma factor-like helix-turn-helix DNA-binding protein [Streptomyces sp. ADI93-02]
MATLVHLRHATTHDVLACWFGVGLYPAMCKLSPRQFDVVVLKAIGKYDTKHIAWYMGLTPSTVTHHWRKAQERLAPIHRRATRPIHRRDAT